MIQPVQPIYRAWWQERYKNKKLENMKQEFCKRVKDKADIEHISNKFHEIIVYETYLAVNKRCIVDFTV